MGMDGVMESEDDDVEAVQQVKAEVMSMVKQLNIPNLTNEDMDVVRDMLEGGYDVDEISYTLGIVSAFITLFVTYTIVLTIETYQLRKEREREEKLDAEIFAEIDAQVDVQVDVQVDAEVDAEVVGEVEARVDVELPIQKKRKPSERILKGKLKKLGQIRMEYLAISIPKQPKHPNKRHQTLHYKKMLPYPKDLNKTPYTNIRVHHNRILGLQTNDSWKPMPCTDFHLQIAPCFGMLRTSKKESDGAVSDEQRKQKVSHDGVKHAFKHLHVLFTVERIN
ncbi:hypothetical protein LXL04_002082 [Taraxacum kok-saghyz]